MLDFWSVPWHTFQKRVARDAEQTCCKGQPGVGRLLWGSLTSDQVTIDRQTRRPRGRGVGRSRRPRSKRKSAASRARAKPADRRQDQRSPALQNRIRSQHCPGRCTRHCPGLMWKERANEPKLILHLHCSFNPRSTRYLTRCICTYTTCLYTHGTLSR